MLLFCDSFDHYQTAQLNEKYIQAGGGAAISSPGQGRFGRGQCLVMNYLQGEGAVQYTSTADQSQFIVGFAFNPSGLPAPVIYNKVTILSFADNDGVQGTLQLTNAGSLEYHVTI